jgi:hypothetical protein
MPPARAGLVEQTPGTEGDVSEGTALFPNSRDAPLYGLGWAGLWLGAEAGNVSIDETADELKCVPKGSRRPLVKFVFAPNGFLWALLKGVDPARELTMAVSAEDLAAIMWKDTPLPQQQRPLVLSGTAH